MFNNGKWAANAGAGARYIDEERVWGANFYYDYRDTRPPHYNQVSLGFESLSEVWDFRLSGYLPVGKTASSFDPSEFAKFSGHSLYFSRKREIALGGINAEAGCHVNKCTTTPLYIAAGPYYLQGHGKTAWGGELRAALDLGTYIRLEGNTSYDSLFHWIGQGQVSLIIPFGNRRVVRNTYACCPRALALSKRALQRVDRNEIIPVDNKHKIAKLRSANFIFVDNESHSAGTWKSPYPDVLTAEANSAPGDILYVLPGNGNPYDVTAGPGLTHARRAKALGLFDPA